MNTPQQNLTDTQPLDIGDVRRQIDSIDAQLADLIARRCGLSAHVAAAKRAAGDTAFGWRPARETEILRTVMREQASLDPQLAFCIWRALISANLAAQGDLTIVATDAQFASAKAAFSVGTFISCVANAGEVLAAVIENDHAIGVLPWPNGTDWWVRMTAPEYAALHVCAATPLLGTPPDALLIAARPPEEAGDDISLVCGPIGALEGGVIATANGLELVAIGEFLESGSALPAGCRWIGSFALA